MKHIAWIQLFGNLIGMLYHPGHKKPVITDEMISIAANLADRALQHYIERFKHDIPTIDIQQTTTNITPNNQHLSNTNIGEDEEDSIGN